MWVSIICLIGYFDVVVLAGLDQSLPDSADALPFVNLISILRVLEQKDCSYHRG